MSCLAHQMLGFARPAIGHAVTWRAHTGAFIRLRHQAHALYLVEMWSSDKGTVRTWGRSIEPGSDLQGEMRMWFTNDELFRVEAA